MISHAVFRTRVHQNQSIRAERTVQHRQIPVGVDARTTTTCEGTRETTKPWRWWSFSRGVQKFFKLFFLNPKLTIFPSTSQKKREREETLLLYLYLLLFRLAPQETENGGDYKTKTCFCSACCKQTVKIRARVTSRASYQRYGTLRKRYMISVSFSFSLDCLCKY